MVPRRDEDDCKSLAVAQSSSIHSRRDPLVLRFFHFASPLLQVPISSPAHDAIDELGYAHGEATRQRLAFEFSRLNLDGGGGGRLLRAK